MRPQNLKGKKYLMNIFESFKKEKYIKRNQKIIDNSMMNFDPLNQDKSAKRSF